MKTKKAQTKGTPKKSVLQRIAAKVKTGYEFMGSKWGNCEAEVIALQTLTACAVNEREHGEALSWLGQGCLRGRDMAGTDNAGGLARVLKDGSLVKERYTGNLTPPLGTATEGGKPLVLRCSDSFLLYAASLLKVKVEIS